MVAHLGYDLSDRTGVIVHEWCADRFHEDYTDKRLYTWWYLNPASDLVYGKRNGRPLLPMLCPGPAGTSREQRWRLQELRGEL